MGWGLGEWEGMLNIYISKHIYKLESGIIYVISYNRENVKCKHKKKA